MTSNNFVVRRLPWRWWRRVVVVLVGEHSSRGATYSICAELQRFPPFSSQCKWGAAIYSSVSCAAVSTTGGETAATTTTDYQEQSHNCLGTFITENLAA